MTFHLDQVIHVNLAHFFIPSFLMHVPKKKEEEEESVATNL